VEDYWTQNAESQIVKAFGVPLTTVKRSLDDGRLKGIKK
jgi:hypothetical protein